MWAGTYGNYNPEFQLGSCTLNGFFLTNFGQFQTEQGGEYNNAADIFGYCANVRTGYKYGQTVDDITMLDMIYASGDDNGIDDKKYSGVLPETIGELQDQLW